LHGCGVGYGDPSRWRIVFIDFDGFCQPESVLDVALLRTTVKSICLPGGADPRQLRDLATLYEELPPHSRPTRR